jgi:dTDP-D-glucose 4,6-dehydratase
MDSSRIYTAGWMPETDLSKGLRMTYDWYQSQERLRDAA